MKKQIGYSLIELMVAGFLGIFVVGGMLTICLKSKVLLLVAADSILIIELKLLPETVLIAHEPAVVQVQLVSTFNP
jgi:hypothetical protein